MKGWPSVTRMFSDLGVTDASRVPGAALERGRHVHLALQYLEDDDLDEQSLPEEYRGQVESWKKFRALHHPVKIHCEHEFASPLWKLVGHPDYVCRMHESLWVLDWKNGSPMRWHRLQTACYSLLIEDADMGVPRRGCVYLRPDGRVAKLDEHTNHRDRDVALAMRTVWEHLHGNESD